MMDKLAAELKIDPAELRRKNFIQSSEFPFTNNFGLMYDSGNYQGTLDKALRIVGYDELRQKQAQARQQGKYLGIGLSTWIEICGFGPSAATAGATGGLGLTESAMVRMHPTGTVQIYVGSHAHGQGHETTFAQIASAAYGANLPEGEDQGMEAIAYFDPPNFVWPFGAHVCVVEVDPATGDTKIQQYVAVDDCGTVINPLIVEGQLHGGIAQGIAQALYEEVAYDEESGQPMTGTLVDYLVPTANEIPTPVLDSTVTPSPTNALGVKGIGEAGTIAASAAVINAIVDALEPLGIKHVDMPATPDRLWKQIRDAQE